MWLPLWANLTVLAFVMGIYRFYLQLPSPSSELQPVTQPAADPNMPSLLSLFDRTYLRRPMTPGKWVVLILYAPFGTVLAILRIIAAVLLCSFAILSEKYLPFTLSDRTLFRLICYISGVFITDIKGKLPGKHDLDHSFITCNHTFTGDPGLLHFLFPHNARVVHKSNVGSFDIITRHKILVGGDKQQVKETIVKEIARDPTPVIIYPEGATTNGLSGLLRFSSFIFGLNRPVQPVALRYYAGLDFIPFHAIYPYYSFHMFLVAFQPYVLVDAVVLPLQTRRDDESAAEFADRVQRMTAEAAKLYPTTYTAQDKTDLRKLKSK